MTTVQKSLLMVMALGWLGGCAKKSYVYYLIDPALTVDETFVETGEERYRPQAIAPDQVMTVRFNDGKVFTEVDIPLFTSGQRVLIKGRQTGSADAISLPDPGFIPPPPSANDSAHKAMRDAYLARGMKENQQAPEVSLSKSRTAMRQAISDGNYVLALRQAENVLARFPSHPEFMRAKGTILLLMGEKEQALDVYESAQQLEYDPAVERKLNELRRQ